MNSREKPNQSYEINMKNQYITKSKFISGTQCPRKLWLDCNSEYEKRDVVPGSIIDIGNKIGVAATTLFPDGILLGSELSQAEALSKTEELVNDPNTKIIFEAALLFNRTLVRVDILDRINETQWRLIEVKSGNKIKEHHLLDAAFQNWVLGNAGIEVCRVEIGHPDGEYHKNSDEIEHDVFIKFEDVTENIKKFDIETELNKQFIIIAETNPPEIHPHKNRCSKPHPCDHWGSCTKDKPSDWIQKLYRFASKEVEKLAKNGIESISQLQGDYVLNEAQEKEAQVIRSGEANISENLSEALSTFGPPAYYLDFEFIRSSIPLFIGTKTNELIAFQWSCHFIENAEALKSLSIDDMLKLDSTSDKIFHQEFLAEGADEPSKECAKKLLEVVGKDEHPIIVYHQTAEKSAIESLARRCPEYSDRLLALLPRLRDLLPVVRDNACLPEFFHKPVSLGTSTYSIKITAHAFCPEFDYADLSDVSQGASASEAYYRLVTGEFSSGEDEVSLRQALLEYCKYDTVAMMVLHKTLLLTDVNMDQHGTLA